MAATMELPVICFEAEIINRFESNPSLMSRLLLHISDEIFRVSSLWTLGALLLAFLATFFRRRKLLLFRRRLRGGGSSSSAVVTSPPTSADSDSDDVSSVSSSSDDDEEVQIFDDDDDDDLDSVSNPNFGEDRPERRNRKFRLSRRRSSSDGRFSWSDFVNGKSVVKTWDGLGLGLGLGFESSSGLISSLWDLSKEDEITASSCYDSGRTSRFPATGAPSPAVVVSAGIDERRNNIGLKVWDARLGRRNPAIFAEWEPRRRKSPAASVVEVRDMRNVAAPLEELTESEVETWWDADAVIVDGDSDIWRLDRGSLGGSVVSRCRNAVLSYLF
ncbi:hypothetical protein Scep_022605 [Stephania cephalantha]|uniref:Uncharacterized protein n=1 Tax=Stephania cephalantha TaxID=152367 RepID=A0AAP0F6R8_9MAGN